MSASPTQSSAVPSTRPEAPSTEASRAQTAKSQLSELYTKHVKPLEALYKYDAFKGGCFEDNLKDDRPMVSVFGPWSSGKTSFINTLLGDNYLLTGPQPTTSDFSVIMHGDALRETDGRVLASSKNLPFQGVSQFGDDFLECFKGYVVPASALRCIIVDTPGVLESVQEVHRRKYDYIRVSKWFADHSDLILVMFDPTKLDSGVELRMLFKHTLKGNEGKVRIILNKADSVNSQELMRVYGALMWNLSSLIDSTEPPRVYVGSYWDKPYRPGTHGRLFNEEKADLLYEIAERIPAQALDRKVTNLSKRARDVMVHAAITGFIRSGLPKFFGREKAKRKAMEGLQATYEKVALEYNLNWRDFPSQEEYKDFLVKFDIESFPEISKVESKISDMQKLINTVLPRLLAPIKGSKLAGLEASTMLRARYSDQLRRQIEGKDTTDNVTGNAFRAKWMDDGK